MGRMLRTRTAGGVVVNAAGEILVVSQRGTSWSLPKGHIDPGEDALEAAKREIWEESGVSELELVRELGTYERQDRKSTRLNSSHLVISYAVFCLKKKKHMTIDDW